MLWRCGRGGGGFVALFMGGGRSGISVVTWGLEGRAGRWSPVSWGGIKLLRRTWAWASCSRPRSARLEGKPGGGSIRRELPCGRYSDCGLGLRGTGGGGEPPSLLLGLGLVGGLVKGDVASLTDGGARSI